MACRATFWADGQMFLFSAMELPKTWQPCLRGGGGEEGRAVGEKLQTTSFLPGLSSSPGGCFFFSFFPFRGKGLRFYFGGRILPHFFFTSLNSRRGSLPSTLKSEMTIWENDVSNFLLSQLSFFPSEKKNYVGRIQSCSGTLKNQLFFLLLLLRLLASNFLPFFLRSLQRRGRKFLS